MRPIGRSRRHGRPQPLGGRFRLPTLRVSGAAMAMSTVVGISIATTWLLNEQSHVRRAPGISSEGASPPVPSPDGTPAPSPSPRPTEQRPIASETVHPKPVSDPITGRARAERVGPSGARHTVTLAVAEPLTALQVELRLGRPDALPGITPWTSLPGTTITVTQDRADLVYRFTTPPGLDVHPGSYDFGVRGARPGESRKAAQEHWAASAFGILHPRAVAVRGTFR